MSNKNRKIAGSLFFIVLIILGALLTSNNHQGAGWTLVSLGGLGLFAILLDRLHNGFKNAEALTKKPYWVYSVSVFFVWGVIFIVHLITNSPPHPSTLALVFLGYFIGWLGATIARKVYK